MHTSVITRGLAVAVLAAALCGCAAGGVKVSDEQIGKLKVGETTYADAVALLGKPTTTTNSSNGHRIAVYSYFRAAARPETFIPYVGILVGGADTQSNSVVLTFGADGKLVSWAGSTTEVGVAKNLASGVSEPVNTQQPR